MGQLFKETPQQKEIVLIPFSYSDLSSSKVRPAIIISNDYYNLKSEDMLVVPITTNIKNLSETIPISNKDLEKGILYYESEIRTDKINSIKQDLIKMKIGIINQNTFEEIISKIIMLFK
jgi:mRNA interferase MazF